MSENCLSIGFILLFIVLFVFFKMCEAGETYARIVRADRLEQLRKQESEDKANGQRLEHTDPRSPNKGS